MSIQRLDMDGDNEGGCWLAPDDDGRWVTYEDHSAALLAAQTRADNYQEALSRIAHFGQDTESKLFGADALRMRGIARAALATEGEKR